MFPSLQPSRPTAQSCTPLNPLCQQQIRQQQSAAPVNQIQAMPPHTTPFKRDNPPMPTPMYNAATTHPVFFTDCWRRPPFPIPINSGFNAAATGYVFGDSRRKSHSWTKL